MSNSWLYTGPPKNPTICTMQEMFRSIDCASCLVLTVNFCWCCFCKMEQNSVQSGSEPQSVSQLDTERFYEGLEGELCINCYPLIETQLWIMITIFATEHSYPKIKVSLSNVDIVLKKKKKANSNTFLFLSFLCCHQRLCWKEGQSQRLGCARLYGQQAMEPCCGGDRAVWWWWSCMVIMKLGGDGGGGAG